MHSIIKATRASAAHLATAQRHGRALRDAERAGDARAIAKLTALRDAAMARHEKARNAATFPWEV